MAGEQTKEWGKIQYDILHLLSYGRRTEGGLEVKI